MVGVEHDDGVVLVFALVQRLKHTPDLRINKVHTGQVRLHQRLPLVLLQHPLVRRRDMLEPSEVDRVGREVVEVVLRRHRQLDLVDREFVEPLLGGELRDVRAVEPDAEE